MYAGGKQLILSRQHIAGVKHYGEFDNMIMIGNITICYPTSTSTDGDMQTYGIFSPHYASWFHNNYGMK